MKKYKYLIISFLITIIINSFFVPIKIKSSIRTYHGVDNIIKIIKANNCKNCFSPTISYFILVIQLLISFIIIYNLIKKGTKKHE